MPEPPWTVRPGRPRGVDKALFSSKTLASTPPVISSCSMVPGTSPISCPRPGGAFALGGEPEIFGGVAMGSPLHLSLSGMLLAACSHGPQPAAAAPPSVGYARAERLLVAAEGQGFDRAAYEEGLALLEPRLADGRCDARAAVLLGELELGVMGQPAWAPEGSPSSRVGPLLERARACGVSDPALGMRLVNLYKRLRRGEEAKAFNRERIELGDDLALWSYQLMNDLYLGKRYTEAIAEGERLAPLLGGTDPMDRGRFLDFLARSYLAVDQPDQAEAVLLESLRLVERQHASEAREFISCPYLTLGGLYRDRGRPEDGLLLLVKAAEAEPEKADSQEAAARFAYEVGRFPLALIYAERAQALAPTPERHELLETVRGTASEGVGADPKIAAAIHNERAIEAAVEAFEAHAFAELELLLASRDRASSDPRWQVLEALVSLLGRQPGRAGSLLEDLRVREPELPSVFAASAHLAVLEQDHAEVLRHLTRAQELLDGPVAPRSLSWFPAWGAMVQHLVWLAEGWSAGNQGRHEEALAAFDRLLVQIPGHPFAQLGAGNALLALGELGEAERLFQQVLEDDPDNQQATAQLALTWLQRGDLVEAERGFLRAMKLGPDGYTCPHEGLGLVYLQRGQESAAARHFEEAITLNPDIEYAKYNGLAGILMNQGRLDEAEVLLRKSMENVPWEPTAARLLEELERRRMADPDGAEDEPVAGWDEPAIASPAGVTAPSP